MFSPMFSQVLVITLSMLCLMLIWMDIHINEVIPLTAKPTNHPIPVSTGFKCSETGMIRQVHGACFEKHKVLNRIILFIAINMVNCFRFKNWPFQGFFHNKDMLKNIPEPICPMMVRRIKQNITPSGDGSSIVPPGVVCSSKVMPMNKPNWISFNMTSFLTSFLRNRCLLTATTLTKTIRNIHLYFHRKINLYARSNHTIDFADDRRTGI